jgi:hypothetical protein
VCALRYYSLGDVARAYHADQPKLDDGELPVLAVAEKDPQFPHFLRKVPLSRAPLWLVRSVERRPEISYVYTCGFGATACGLSARVERCRDEVQEARLHVDADSAAGVPLARSACVL